MGLWQDQEHHADYGPGEAWRRALPFFQRCQRTERSFCGDILSRLDQEDPEGQLIKPAPDNLFKVLRLTAPEDVKVVILGQDPYQDGSATGLAFSIQGTPPPRSSLNKIFVELERDIGQRPLQGDLTSWANNGVLLLNVTLTVPNEGTANAHKDYGWDMLAKMALFYISRQGRPIAFALWGGEALTCRAYIHPIDNLILCSGHPRGGAPPMGFPAFKGSKPFSKINDFLVEKGLEPIDWACSRAQQPP